MASLCLIGAAAPERIICCCATICSGNDAVTTKTAFAVVFLKLGVGDIVLVWGICYDASCVTMSDWTDCVHCWNGDDVDPAKMISCWSAWSWSDFYHWMSGGDGDHFSMMIRSVVGLDLCFAWACDCCAIS